MKCIKKITSLILVLALLLGLFVVPAYAIGAETVLATLGGTGLNATGAATLSGFLSTLGISVGGVALAVAGGVAVALLLRHITSRLSPATIDELNTGVAVVNEDLVNVTESVLPSSYDPDIINSVELSNPYNWNKARYQSTKSNWDDTFIGTYCNVLPNIVLTNVVLNVYNDSTGALICPFDEFNSTNPAWSTYVRYVYDISILNTFTGQSAIDSVTYTVNMPSVFGKAEMPAVEGNEILAYRMGSAGTAPYQTKFYYAIPVVGGWQPVGSIGATDNNYRLMPMIPIYSGATASTIPLTYINGISMSGQVIDNQSLTYDRDNTPAILETVLTPPLDWQNDFVDNPDGSVSLSHDLVINPSIPDVDDDAPTWIGNITGAISTGIDGVISTITDGVQTLVDTITSPFGHLDEFVDGISDFFDGSSNFNDLFSHYLPACVAQYVWVGFLILIAFWILRLILNR